MKSTDTNFAAFTRSMVDAAAAKVAEELKQRLNAEVTLCDAHSGDVLFSTDGGLCRKCGGTGKDNTAGPVEVCSRCQGARTEWWG